MKNHTIPQPSEVIKQVVVQGKHKVKTLTFQLSWLDKFKWLAYSCNAGGGLCKYCVLFPPSIGVVTSNATFVTKPFRKAGGKKGLLQIHGTLQYHRNAAARAQAFLSVCQNPKSSIQHYISQQCKQQYKTNLHILSCIIKALLYCGRQNIGLRGHRDDHTSTAFE